MAIEAYSLARDGEKQLSANFKVREFYCRDGSDPIFVDLIYNDPLAYAELILNGEPEKYLRNVAGSHGLED